MMWQTAFNLLKETYNEWTADKAPRLGAALAYYSAFSIAPLVMLVIAAASLVFPSGPDGTNGAQQAIIRELSGTLGEPVGQAINSMINNAKESGSTTLSTLVGLATLLVGASFVFGELQDSLNTIWKVEPKPNRGIVGIIKDRFLSFTMVVGTGFLLLVSLVISTALAVLSRFMQDNLPGGVWLWQSVNWVVTLAFIALVFALIYKLVPDVKLAWGDVWIGALVTAVLFAAGKAALGLYLGWSSTTSAYGAAGSLVVILLWVFYSAQILLFGAEFTRVYARRHGTRGVVADNAVPVTAEARARQGMPRREEVEAAAALGERGASAP